MAKSKGQGELPGVLPEVQDFPEITRAAKRLREQRAEWQELGAKVSKSKDALAAAMRERGIRSYVTKLFRIELVEGKEQIKIRDLNSETVEEES